MFVRICPYLPFSARVCLNQHHWLANRMREEGILARLTPFFNAKEREEAGCQHRLFFSQIEFCDNLIFHRRAALDSLGERLLDAKAPFQLAANDHLASGINSVDLEYRLWRRPNRLS
jgi:hypothetical protein